MEVLASRWGVEGVGVMLEDGASVAMTAGCCQGTTKVFEDMSPMDVCLSMFGLDRQGWYLVRMSFFHTCGGLGQLIS